MRNAQKRVSGRHFAVFSSVFSDVADPPLHLNQPVPSCAEEIADPCNLGGWADQSNDQRVDVTAFGRVFTLS
jgi:hypothetical protein